MDNTCDGKQPPQQGDGWDGNTKNGSHTHIWGRTRGTRMPASFQGCSLSTSKTPHTRRLSTSLCVMTCGEMIAFRQHSGSPREGLQPQPTLPELKATYRLVQAFPVPKVQGDEQNSGWKLCLSLSSTLYGKRFWPRKSLDNRVKMLLLKNACGCAFSFRIIPLPPYFHRFFWIPAVWCSRLPLTPILFCTTLASFFAGQQDLPIPGQMTKLIQPMSWEWLKRSTGEDKASSCCVLRF